MPLRRQVKSGRGVHLWRETCALACLIAAPVNAQDLPWEIWKSPANLASVGTADLVVEHSSHCPQGCRYDRSNPGPESPLDNPTPLRWLYRDGDEVVIFDERGPGALTRFWMTTGDGPSSCIDPAIRIRFRFDDAVTPLVDLPLASIFDGSQMAFTPPLVADRLSASGGFVSRVPMAYAQSLQISLSGAEGGSNPCTGDGFGMIWYQFLAHRLPFDSKVVSFSPADNFPAWRDFLAPRGADPWNGMLAPQPVIGILQPGSSLSLLARSGSGWLRGIRLQVPARQRADIYLRVVVDDQTAVDMPLTDFFAFSTNSILPTRSVFFGEDAAGSLYSWWPMPHSQAASIELVAGSGLSSSVEISGSISVDSAPVLADAGRFQASLVDNCSGGIEFQWLDEIGAGKVVGFASRYRANGVSSRGYLEGDERVTFDGAVTPAWYGTGVEDFFDAGFYFDNGEFSSALSGASETDPDGNGATAAYRIFATDPMVYTRSIRWIQEAGYSPALPVPACARGVVYRYHREQPLTVSHGRFETGDPVQSMAHAYQASPWAVCATQSGYYPDEPPSERVAVDCRYNQGQSRFTYNLSDLAGPLRLRRTFDAAHGIAGTTASAPAAEVRVNGVSAGWFPPAAVNRARRWQEQEILLADILNAGELQFEIIPAFNGSANGFGESAWELLGGWVDRVFSDPFDGSATRTARP